MTVSSKYFFVMLIVIIAVMSSGCAQQAGETEQDDGQQQKEGEEVQISIKDFAFEPSTVTVKIETTVTWTNEDAASHTATGNDFDSGNLKKGQKFSYTFNEAGTFDNICTIHPSMKGKVIVE